MSRRARWKRIRELYGAGTGRIALSHADAALLVRKWFIYDWPRVVAVVVGFVSQVRAISVPFPEGAEFGGG